MIGVKNEIYFWLSKITQCVYYSFLSEFQQELHSAFLFYSSSFIVSFGKSVQVMKIIVALISLEYGIFKQELIF